MRSLGIVLGIILVDHATKIAVVNTMYRGQSIPVLGDWLRLTYTENPGMAFGIEMGPPALVSIFSIVATILIVLYLRRVGGSYKPYKYSLAFVLGGALGNIIDRVLYGKILYGEPLFLGRVVDFIHVNLWRGYIPESIPVIGGNYFALFPIWNVADMAIVCGVVGIIWFQKKFHDTLEAQPVEAQVDVPSDASTTDGPVSHADAPSEAPASDATTLAQDNPVGPVANAEDETAGLDQKKDVQ